MPISQLLLKQAIPAGVGILMMSIYLIIDTIFVGHYVGSNGIAALTVVMPINMLIATLGMAIGVGGGSIISRSLGRNEIKIAQNTFGLQVILFGLLMGSILLLSYIYKADLLILFGAQGKIFPLALAYFDILLPFIPALAWLMIANNVLRSEGKAKEAMATMIIPALLNIILDFHFVMHLGWGIEGAAWATAIAYFFGACLSIVYFFGNYNLINFTSISFVFNKRLLVEISQLGTVTLLRQGGVNILAIFINQNLFFYGGEMAIAAYGILSKVIIFSFVPLMGIGQGFMPIAGFNYGAQKFDRVKESVNKSIKYGILVVLVMYTLVLLYPSIFVKLFTKEEGLILLTSHAMPITFIASPLFAVQMIGTAYFQSIGRPLPALSLTIMKQFILIVPIIYILSYFYKLEGIWYAFPLSDAIASAFTFIYLKTNLRETTK